MQSVLRPGRLLTKWWNRLFKFPQMDFEMAVWEMTHLLIAPKKVFKSIYYHKREDDVFRYCYWSCCSL